MPSTVLDAGDSTVTETDILVGKDNKHQTHKQNINIIGFNEFCGGKKQGAVTVDNGAECLL